MESVILKYWPLIALVGGGLIGYGIFRATVMSNKANIKELWDKKADADDLDDLKIKMDGIDRWTRDHERISNEVRLKMGERFSSLEKSIEIGHTNHAQSLQIMARLEASFEKLEDKFDGFTGRIEKALAEFARRADGGRG